MLHDIEPDLDSLILVVSGAHLRAELNDRHRALELAATIRERAPHAQVAAITDIWYLNNDDLRTRPAVSVGNPDVNAFTAFLADKLPAALTIDDTLTVQIDLEFVDPIAACWGVTHAQTAVAVDTFVDRYLDAFIRRAVS